MNKPDKWQECDKFIYDFITNKPNLAARTGYRQIKMQIGATGLNISERRIRKVMRDNNLLAWQTKSMKRYNSYKNDGNPPAKNWLYDSKAKKHFFSAESIWETLGTDVTEFHVNGFKVFLSPIIDFKDSMPVAWRISKHPNTELIVRTVQDLINRKPEGGYVLHMDQGSVNRSYAMKDICRNNHILQSMSRRGKLCDNAPTEGFFGRLKQEWFNKTDFTGYTYKRFVQELNNWLKWYCFTRKQIKLGKMSPIEYRNMLKLKKVV